MNVDNLDELDIPLPDEFNGLPVFAVGGVVRDTIRGVESSDTDLMVAEVSESEMKSRGFREIDSDNNETFGVFQDSLGREVALPREEKSTGDGHKDFKITPVSASTRAREAVLLDLERRDFTVNALAFDVRHETLHDPRGGVQDLKTGILRAVNADAFKQDPLRILRGARFASRLGFEIDEITLDAMSESVKDIESLPQERVRMEMTKALVQSENPRRFFDVLDEIGALEYTFPELGSLKSIPAGPQEYHKEGSSYEHTMMVLEEMNDIRPKDEIALLMALSHDIGKGRTSEEDLPSHPIHGELGTDVVDDMQKRLSLSNEQANAMKEASRYHMQLHDIDELRESTVIDIVQNVDNIPQLITLTVADGRGREPSSEANPEKIAERLGLARAAVEAWTGKRLIEDGYDPDDMGGKEFGDLLRQKRVEWMREKDLSR